MKKQVPTEIEILRFFVSSIDGTTALNVQNIPRFYKDNNFKNLCEQKEKNFKKQNILELNYLPKTKLKNLRFGIPVW